MLQRQAVRRRNQKHAEKKRKDGREISSPSYLDINRQATHRPGGRSNTMA